MEFSWTYVWLILVAVSVVIELLTMDLLCVWFVPSGLVSMVLAIFDVPLWVQIVVFVVLSVAFIVLLRKPCMAKLNRGGAKTNADRNVGKECTLLTSVSFEKAGSVRLNGLTWTAVSEDEKETIEEGTLVTVLRIEGNKVVVRKK